MSEQKKPEAGEWWRTKEGIGKIIGTTTDGIVFIEFEGNSFGRYVKLSEFEHLPDCDSFEWQPETFPQWYEPLLDACAAYGIRTSKTELIVVQHDGKQVVREWQPIDETRKQVTQAEAEARVKKPEPVESPDDWVTQDRVPARARIDQEHWSNWGVDEWHTIGPNQISSQRKMMHGNVDEHEDTLSLRCRRRDLPPLPQETPKREYVKVWLRWGNDRLYATTTGSDDPKDRELKHDGTGFYLEDGK